MSERLKSFLRVWLSEWRIFRRWHGGKWSLWYINLSLTKNPLWMAGWERPGCGLWWIEREDFGETFYPRLHRFNGANYIAVADYDRKVAELKSLIRSPK